MASRITSRRGNGRAAPLIPTDDATTRSLAAVIAILTFLAALAAGAAEIVGTRSAGWKSSIEGQATIQLRPRSGRDIEADLARAAAVARATPGVVGAKILSRSDSEDLLEPWLGRGLDLGALPTPRVIALRLTDSGRDRLPALADRVAAEIPGTSLDDHGAWMSRLSRLAGLVIAFAVGFVILVVIAAALAVGFATRGVIAGSREVIEILHLVGADEDFVARAFAWRLLRLALLAGAAGAVAAAILIVAAGLFADVPGSSAPSEAGFALGLAGYLLIGTVPLTVAAIAGAISWLTVKRLLRPEGRA